MTTQHPAYGPVPGRVDLVPGTLRGYRAWHWESVTQRLRSTGWSHLWEQGPQQQPDATCLSTRDYKYNDECPCAICVLGLHASPAPECSCGYYASYDPEGYQSQAAVMVDGFHIHGTVSAHGLVVLGTGGFRAQRVQVDAFWGFGNNTHEAAQAYRVPWFPSLSEMLRKFPPSNVTELLR